jgi:hypothetical protein
MLLHNPRDELVPISEGERARAVLLGADADDRGGGDLDQIGAFTCQRYRDGENPVLWCPHRRDRTSRGRYYPHQWPEGVGEAVSLFIEELSGESMAADAAPGLAEAHSIPDEWLAERTSGHDEADVIGTERCASGSSFLTNATPSVAPQGVARRACLTRP